MALLSSAFSPVKRERDSNREVPNVFAYANDLLEKQDYYNKAGIRKFGWWIEIKKRKHQELKELGAGGWAERLFKAFSKIEIPCAVFIVFCQGGFDFVGGFVLQQLIKKPLFNEIEAVTTRLGELNLSETHGIKDGE